MAEAVVCSAIERASSFLIAEASFLHGVRGDVERLQAELKRMRSFLKDMDGKHDQNDRVRNWVAEIRSIAYDAEDIIDEFLLRFARREITVCSFRRITSLFTKCCHLHETGTRIMFLYSRLVDMANSMQLYGIILGGEEESGSTTEMQRRVRRSYPHEEEENLISLEGCTRDLMAQLMREEDRVRVVSIVGMGGLGKTTLAKKVYNKTEVKRHFDSCSWAFLSQQFSLKSVLFGILKDVAPQEIRGTKIKEGEEQLTLKLYNILKDRLYLVVLDDMWQNEAWDSLKHAFPNGKVGSKIILTTRSKEIALYADPWMAPTEMPFLSDEESWNLLKNKAFPRDIFGNNYCFVQELEELGKEMARKCGGLPLAIVVLGGLLATKKSPKEWEEVHENMTTQFIKLDQKQQYRGVYQILALSYHALPWYLKPCFLYFSTFPKGAKIFKNSLVRMWIAEGFVSQPGIGNETLEDVGEEYTRELVSRCMIQVEIEDDFIDGWHWRGAKTWHMHDLMRDMCVSKAREENFLEVVDDHGGTGEPSTVEAANILSSTSRRILIHCTSQTPQHYLSMIKGKAHLRTLFYAPQLPKVSYVLREQDLRLISKNFRLLRVLNIGVATSLTGVPRAIGNLIHLRYLRWSIQGSLPASIGNLRNLHSLDLRGSDELCLPNVLWKLEFLRHLLVDAPQAAGCRVDTLKSLETLRWVRAEFLLKEDAILKLTNLRHLGITFKKADEVEVILRFVIMKVSHIRSLCMEMAAECSFPTLESISGCHRLYKILLNGRISEQVHSFGRNLLEFLPVTLAKITLSQSGLKQDPMPVLGKLPILTSLRLLEKVYRGSQMVCSADGFPKLESLEFEGLRELEEWIIEKGTLPHLKILIIGDLDNLRMIPEGLMFATSLHILDLRLLPGEFKRRVGRIDGKEGEDFHKVQHVPQVKL